MATAEPIIQQKTAVRAAVLQQRRALSADARAHASAVICNKILQLAAFQSAARLIAFCPLADEVDIWSLITTAAAAGKTVALPRVAGRRRLSFHAFCNREQLQSGYAGILEPPASAAAVSGFGADDFALIPAVAVNLHCYRLGYGGGYYDFFLSQYPFVFTCIPVFACQIVEQLPLESHDQSAKLIVSES